MASALFLVPTAVELLRLAYGTLLRPQQQEQGQPQAEAVAALRAHLAQDDAASLKQDLKALARLLEQAMLEGGEESGEDMASSTTITTGTTTTARRLAAAFSETLNLTGANRKLGMPFSSSSPPPFAKDEKHAGAPAVHGAGLASPSCYLAPPSNPLMTPSLLNEIFDYVGLMSSSPSVFLCIDSSKSISLSSSFSSSSSSSAAAGAGAAAAAMTPDMAAVMAARTSLGDLACVCKLWKATASEDRYWRPLSTAFLPMLGTDPTTTTTTTKTTKKPLAPGTPSIPTQLQSPCRDALVQYGKALVMPTVRDGDDWQAHLLLSFEVIDERDSLRLFSASGPVDLILSSESGLTALRLTGAKRTEICRPFSAASRDLEKRRFKTIKDFFAHGSQPQYPASLRVRVVGTDTRTGKQALLYSSHPGTQRSVKVSTLQYWQQYLAADSLFVWEPWSRWSTGDGTQANEVVEISTSFYVSPVQAVRGQGEGEGVEEDVAAAGGGGEAGQQEEGNPEPPPQGSAAAPVAAGPAATALARERAREQLHVVMGGDEGAYSSHNSFVALQFRTLDASVPARFIKAALAAANAATP